MSTDLYAVYDERDGTIVHVHGVPSDAGQSPEDIIAMVDPQQERPLRVLRLPAEGLTRPTRVVDGRIAETTEGGGLGGAGIVFTDQAPPQAARLSRGRRLHRHAGGDD